MRIELGWLVWKREVGRIACICIYIHICTLDSLDARAAHRWSGIGIGIRNSYNSSVRQMFSRHVYRFCSDCDI